MKKLITYVVAGVLIVALLSYMVTYTVRFNETAVKTSFGRTSQLKTEAGLDFMIPIKDSITKYDTRIRLLRTRTETQQTADNKQITVDAFCMWRVSDPGKFFEKFSNAGNRAIDHFEEAESTLTSRLRSSMGAVSRYELDELFTLGDDSGRLPELEASIRDAMRTADESGGSVLDYGIEIVDVGINRVGFPEKNSEAVFALMTASRDRLAKELESEGSSRAQTIRSVAEAKAKKIQNFARNYADRIRAEGNALAQPYYAEMAENQRLAVFLASLDLMRNGLGRQTTLIIPFDSPGMGIFRAGNATRLEDVDLGVGDE